MHGYFYSSERSENLCYWRWSNWKNMSFVHICYKRISNQIYTNCKFFHILAWLKLRKNHTYLKDLACMDLYLDISSKYLIFWLISSQNYESIFNGTYCHETSELKICGNYKLLLPYLLVAFEFPHTLAILLSKPANARSKRPELPDSARNCAV